MNAHVQGYLLAGAALGLGYWLIDKKVETHRGFDIYKGRGRYRVEAVPGVPEHDQVFPTLEEARGWIDANYQKEYLQRTIVPIGDDMLVPPPGRTITASGQVIGLLGFDVYDAAPYQYNRTPRNDFVPGLGFGISINRPKNPSNENAVYRWQASMVTRRGSANGQWVLDQKATDALRAKNAQAQQLKMETLAQQKVNETLLAIQKRAEEEMAAQQAAQQKVPKVPAVAVSETYAPVTKPAAAPSNYDQAKQAYDIMQAAREQESMSQASSDTGYGTTSNDYGLGPAQTVTEEGAPPMPESVTSIATPSATMAPPAEQAQPTGDAKVGLLVGGGIAAAVAAALLF